ncbi:prestin-like isoform X2 [Ruditapes philippinarum]|nr:prestin-like isoform X2 [Ruditapes philippinarum]XP_060582832.1 prestin-like isoform X2 [Ruditapes philippinarum]
MTTNCECRKLSDFREQFRKLEKDETAKKPCCVCDKQSAKARLNRLVPMIRIMKKYNWKTDFIADMICGLTVGIMQLPQGMAYAMLAEMPPVVGLYMSFFPVLIYFIFGSSKHISMGTVAVVSLLTGSVVAKFYVDDNGGNKNTLPGNSSLIGNGTSDPFEDSNSEPFLPVSTKLGIVMTISLLVGFTQIIMGVLRLGFVTTYMSDPLIAGFTTGTAVHVGTSQVKYILGLKIPRTDGLFQVVKTYKFIFERITHTNVATLIVSLICIVILYLVKVQINQRFKAKLKIPVPIELFVVIIGTVTSYFSHFHENYHIKVVGNVPAGLPEPALPSFEGVDKYIADIPIIAIISFAQSVSLAAMMAKKNKYAIDANQELIAYGAGNVFGSFFSCYPYAASVSRSSVQDSAGGKSQIASLFSASMVLIVILWLGPLFESLPNCVLSAIIVVALRSLILQVLELPKIWRTSKYDFYIWVVTCLSATLLHVDYGLMIGLVFSFFTVVLRTQMARPTRLGKITDQNVYKDPKKYLKTSQLTNEIKVIGYNYPIYFANGDLFVREVYRLATIKPEVLRKQIRRASQMSESLGRSTTSMSTMGTDMGSNNTIVKMQRQDSIASTNGQLPEIYDINPFEFEIPVTHIIIDFSAVSFVDSVGCKVIKTLIQDYENVHVRVYLTNISDEIWNVFEATEIIPARKDIMFVSLDDAIEAARTDSKPDIRENGLSKISFM